MRKIIGLISVFICLTGSQPPEESPHSIHALQHIHQEITQENQQMEWKVLIKDSIDTNLLQKIEKNDENRHLVTSTIDKNRVQYTMDNIGLIGIDATFHINHYTNDNQAEVIIEIQGNQWNEQIAEEYDKYVTQLRQFYISENAHIFACLSATYSATISRSELEMEIIGLLELQHISYVADPLTDPQKQMVVSGYSPQFEEAISIENEEFNTQIVINTKDDEQISVMIGTPIITVEY